VGVGKGEKTGEISGAIGVPKVPIPEMGGCIDPIEAIVSFISVEVGVSDTVSRGKSKYD
jgi:hypothetical protein